MLLEILKNKTCFKLICGAGNEDTDEIEKLTYLYSLAGCKFFDLCAKSEVIDAAKRGLKRANKLGDCYLCISVGSESDQHFCKAVINNSTCTNCHKCKDVCLQNAIETSGDYTQIDTKKCIGCKKCINVCPTNSVTLTQKTVDYKKLLPNLIKKGLDCIEFHILGNEGDEIFTKWQDINDLYDGILSISINRAILGDTALIQTIEKLVNTRKPYTTIIQADGIPMSGGKDSYKSTLQAVAIADMFRGANLPVYIIASGGTNSKTTELAKLCEVNLDGVAIGSYARKIVKEYTERDDFFENKEVINQALQIATQLVETSLKNLK